jgi:Zn-dependent peptidase ImmA (M78 family)
VTTTALDALADEARSVLAELEDRFAHDQGRAVARWLRERLSIADASRVEPEAILQSWRVPIPTIELSPRDLDAISIWGPKHGPAVIINRNGRHARMNGLRATLAHEVGHLIMDRRDALPVAEVMGGRISRLVEARARAFAAELLLPESVAGNAIIEPRTKKDLVGVVRRMSEWYGASLEIVAWQARNAHDGKLPPLTRTYLRSLVSNPEGF